MQDPIFLDFLAAYMPKNRFLKEPIINKQFDSLVCWNLDEAGTNLSGT